MSRLPTRHREPSPRLASENNPTPTLVAPTTANNINTRKRKSTFTEDDAPHGSAGPRKIAALGTARPIRSSARVTAKMGTQPTTNMKASTSTSTTASANSTPDNTVAPGKKVPTLSSSNFGKGLPQPKPRIPSATIPRTTPATKPAAGPSTVRPKAPARGAAARAKPKVTPAGRPTRAAPIARGAPPKPKLTPQAQLLARAAAADQLASELSLEHQKLSELQSNHTILSTQLAEARDLEMNHKKTLLSFSDEMDEMRRKYMKEKDELENQLRAREREVREVREDLRVSQVDLEREKGTVVGLRKTLEESSHTSHSLEKQNADLQRQLEATRKELGERNAEVDRLNGALEERDEKVVKLQKEVFESEAIRRKLHNMVLELKGNIRVFARVRPILASDLPSTPPTSEEMERMKQQMSANMEFPDSGEDKTEIVIRSTSESAMGSERKEVYNFGFDRVFEPQSTQAEVFEEISQLAQSCIDGYNVCIFAYGQTGSGKSFTMEGGPTDETAGMIPRAVDQVFRVASEMKSKGWEYTIEGQFLEIYNETIHDLLIPSTAPDADKKKHEIKHDPKTGRTSVTEATVVRLTSPAQVRNLLLRAQGRRSVAATLMNERSSRSHSVFTLRISGINVGVRSENGAGAEVVGTGERCEGCLNLVDLAGSERLNVSFGPGVTEKERVRETQSINKSLSALGDVIAALGSSGANGNVGTANGGGGHIPYRNSKLTYLLQNSLSGSSKTLMVLNLSPLAAHMNESLTSLRFATKVNNTHVGPAKKVVRGPS